MSYNPTRTFGLYLKHEVITLADGTLSIFQFCRAHSAVSMTCQMPALPFQRSSRKRRQSGDSGVIAEFYIGLILDGVRTFR